MKEEKKKAKKHLIFHFKKASFNKQKKATSLDKRKIMLKNEEKTKMFWDKNNKKKAHMSSKFIDFLLENKTRKIQKLFLGKKRNKIP